MRRRELTTDEALEVVQSLARLGCRECALIGGEAYLRRDLPVIIRALAEGGIRVVMQTGGRAFTRERADRLRAAGLVGLGVSLDGPRAVHDELRGNAGSYDAALRAMDNASAAGLILTANTQINRLNHRHLDEIFETIRARGAQTWQVQLTVPMGRAADRPDWIIHPWMIVPIVETLAALQVRAIEEHEGDGPVFNIFANNNIGYFGPHEELLRSRPGGISTHWKGCRAGINLVGLESDGTVKACPSLPTAPYAGATSASSRSISSGRRHPRSASRVTATPPSSGASAPPAITPTPVVPGARGRPIARSVVAGTIPFATIA